MGEERQDRKNKGNEEIEREKGKLIIYWITLFTSIAIRRWFYYIHKYFPCPYLPQEKQKYIFI